MALRAHGWVVMRAHQPPAGRQYPSGPHANKGERRSVRREAGINAVPAVIINDKYLISGGQPAAAFERALRSIAAEAA